jgi:hypothetical protein
MAAELRADGVPAPPKAIHRYEILERLGQGGMGELYLASDPRLDRLVAIKVLRTGFDSAELRERFNREARSAARLAHTNIVTIYDIGSHNGEPFIAMEYVPGDTLLQKIRRRVELPLTTKLQYAEELCAGLAHAHRAGIIHRDIKPANLIIASTDTLKILDFGLARLADSSITQSGVVMGTLNYMSPEQITGQPLDHRSDLFAVGAVLYELLSYRQAFPGGIDTGVLGRITSASPTPLDELCPGIDPDLVEIVERAIAKQPADRFPDLDTMRAALIAVRERAATTALDLPMASTTRESPPAPEGPAPLASQVQRALVRDQIRECMREASSELGRGNLDRARQLLRSIEGLDPDADEARRIRAAIAHFDARSAAGAPTEIAHAPTASVATARAASPTDADVAPVPRGSRQLAWIGPLAAAAVLAIAGVVGLSVLNRDGGTQPEVTVATAPALQPASTEKVVPTPAASPQPVSAAPIAAPVPGPSDAAPKPPAALENRPVEQTKPAAVTGAALPTQLARDVPPQNAIVLRDAATSAEGPVIRAEPIAPPPSVPAPAAPADAISSRPELGAPTPPEPAKPADTPATPTPAVATEPTTTGPAPAATSAPAPTLPLSPARPVTLTSFRSGSEKITFAQRGSGALESKAESCEIRVFQDPDTPPPFVDLGLINYHEERHRTRAGSLTLDAVLPKLKAAACAVGADALVNVRVTDVRRLEFAMFNIRATAVRLTR